jgi:hypothetical protein
MGRHTEHVPNQRQGRDPLTQRRPGVDGIAELDLADLAPDVGLTALNADVDDLMHPTVPDGMPIPLAEGAPEPWPPSDAEAFNVAAGAPEYATGRNVFDMATEHTQPVRQFTVTEAIPDQRDVRNHRQPSRAPLYALALFALTDVAIVTCAAAFAWDNRFDAAPATVGQVVGSAAVSTAAFCTTLLLAVYVWYCRHVPRRPGKGDTCPPPDAPTRAPSASLEPNGPSTQPNSSRRSSSGAA